jgi:hypothetical protein
MAESTRHVHCQLGNALGRHVSRQSAHVLAKSFFKECQLALEKFVETVAHIVKLVAAMGNLHSRSCSS